MKDVSLGTDGPLVTIAIPTMNRRHDLPTSIDSVLAQDYKNFELLISDNGSTDDTPEFCKELEAQDCRVRHIRHEQNIGFMANWNFVLQQAAGKYFMWLGDDDWIEPGTLSAYVEFLENHADYSLVSGNILYWSNGKVIRLEEGLSQDARVDKERTISYYSKVIDGAMVYGLCRTEMAQNIEQENGIGPDWHFVAAMAFQGKLKQLNFLAYNKVLGGNSSSYLKYARVMGISKFWGYAPFFKIAIDSMGIIWKKYPVYQNVSKGTRMGMALRSFNGILWNFYIRRYPYILGGKVLRTLGIKTPNEKRIESLQEQYAG